MELNHEITPRRTSRLHFGVRSRAGALYFTWAGFESGDESPHSKMRRS